MSTRDEHFYDDVPGSLATLRALLIATPALGKLLRRERTVLRTFDVPYLGGISEDGSYVYLDRHLPEKVESIPLAKFLEVHEVTEWALRTMAEIGGIPAKYKGYEACHHLATAAEQFALVSDGYEWDKYKEALRPDYWPIETEQVRRVPPDFSTWQYDSDPKLKERLEVVARKSKFTQGEVNFREGSPRRSCGLCGMFLARLGRCTWVDGTISPDALCDKFDRKKG